MTDVRIDMGKVKLLKNIIYALYQCKQTLLERYYGFRYRCREIVTISECQNKHNKMNFILVSGGYSINGHDNLNDELRKETNLEMKPFCYVSFPRGRLLTDLSRNLAVFDCSNALVDNLTFSYVQNKNGVFYHGGAKDNYFFSAKKIQKPKYIDGIVFSMLTGGGKNFNIYHWFFDSLSRLYAIKNELVNIDFFLVPEYVQDYQIESLRILGINKDKVISSLENKHVIAKELICTSHPRTATFSVRKEITNFLRDRFILPNYNDISKGKFYPARFYISRQDAPRRKVDNETEVILELKKKGIAEIKISNYSFMEVVYLFSNASFILSTHSAALTNILFCKQGTKVVEYFPNLGFLPYYNELSDSLNLDYHLIMDSNPLRNDIKSRYDIQNEESIVVNINLLLNQLNEINENCTS